MPMEIEYFPVDSEDIGEVSEVSAADLVNGKGEPSVEIAGTIGGEDGITIEAINQGGDDQGAEEADSQTSTLDETESVSTITQKSIDRWIDTDEGKEAMARYKAEEQHEKEIAEAKEEHTKASLARAAAEEVFKSCKAEEKATLATLSALIARGPDYPKPQAINQGGDDCSQSSAIDAAVRNDKSSPSLPLDDPNSDQSWRSIPMAPMLDGIKGMGEKKREAILSLTPTLGDFEDLRGKAGLAHKQLAEVMPKGIGQTMVEEIEERALSAMRKHQLELEKVQEERKES